MSDKSRGKGLFAYTGTSPFVITKGSQEVKQGRNYCRAMERCWFAACFSWLTQFDFFLFVCLVFFFFSFLLNIFFIYISNVIPFPCSPASAKPHNPSPSPSFYKDATPPTHSLLSSCPWIPLHWGIKPSTGPRASLAIDAQQSHPLLHMLLEPWIPLCVLLG